VEYQVGSSMETVSRIGLGIKNLTF